jgi:hypothetical protein
MFTLLAGILRKLKALSVDVYVDLVIMLTYEGSVNGTSNRR